MSLALLGFATVVTFVMLIMTKRPSAVSALIGIPIAFGLMGGLEQTAVLLPGHLPMNKKSREQPPGCPLLQRPGFLPAAFKDGLSRERPQ